MDGADIFFLLVLVDIAEDCGRRKRETIFLEGTREDHSQSDKYSNHFKGDVGKTSGRRDGEHMSFTEHINTILNYTKLN